MLMVAKHLSRRAVVLFALASFCLITLTLLSNRLGGVCQDGTYCRNSLGSIRSSNPGRPGGSCSGFPDTSKVLVVMKTTASEAYQKLPAQFMTSLRCASDYIIFSDAEQELGGVQILDGLDQVVDQVKDSNTDFDLYRRQQECLVDLETCTRYDNVTEQATNLDKYKYIHMAEKAFRLKPNYDWYVFVDADTWFSWATLVQWLKHLNAEEEVYFGSAARFGPTAFASGRSGYGVSKAMMRRMFANRKRVAGRWDWGLMESCCGDVMFATAIKEMTKVIVRDTWPTNNGDKPTSLAYGPQQWCQPLATMLMSSGRELSAMHEIEKTLGLSAPIRIKDLFHRFVEPHIVHIREDWDNLSQDVYYLDPKSEHDPEIRKLAKTKNLSPVEQKAHLSFDACYKACASLDNCLQYRFHHGLCALSTTVTLGMPMKKEWRMGDKWMSGWHVDRIKAWVEAHEDCGEVEWPQGMVPMIPEDSDEGQGGLVG